jgi:hypothetical protein
VKHLLERRPRWMRAQNLVVIIPILAIVAVLVALYASQAQTIGIQRSRISTLLAQNGHQADRLDGLTREYTKLYGEAKQSGVQPTTVAPSALPAAGTPGENGRDGRGIAFSLCTATGWVITYTDGTSSDAGTCVGATGKTGAAGIPGVAGKAGATGAAGANGVDGQSVVGPQGPAGPAGPAGADGRDGTDGVGVSSVTCVTEADGSTAFRFTLTDTTTQDVAGACTPPTPSDPTTPGSSE